ncbi:pseudouridine synthase [Sphingomonas sp.]|uniref:pseudouridine synthase n=1 Tax=Sphingomonas sp. TaxID=28214 RepID=UPI0028993F88|nr:pseudouridine synthase [Sphingomonas sp.]
MTSEHRIAKLLARAGVASRREVERMIADGRIALNGTTLDTPATLLSSLDGVTVDGQPVDAPEPTRLFLFNKPNGLLVTEHDPMGRPTIYDRLPADLPRLMPVGRLDLNTEGLLLLTTDGGFKRQLELPATGVERTYRARAYGDVTQAQLEELIHGIEIDGIRYGQIDANLERRTGANVWIEMTLREGKNREVRRVLEHLGLQVSRLIRLRYGPFVLEDLPSGEIGEVKGSAIVEFRKTLLGGIPADAIKPKPRAGFRTPPTRSRIERPDQADEADGQQRKPRERGPRADAGPRGATRGERPNPLGKRAPRADDRPGRAPFGDTRRTSSPTEGRAKSVGQHAAHRPTRHERPESEPVRRPSPAGAERGERNARFGADTKGRARPFGGEGERPTGSRPTRTGDRGDRPVRTDGPPSGRSGRPPNGGRGGRPGGGDRPGRPAGRR